MGGGQGRYIRNISCRSDDELPLDTFGRLVKEVEVTDTLLVSDSVLDLFLGWGGASLEEVRDLRLRLPLLHLTHEFKPHDPQQLIIRVR
ncbi:Hypothetical protein FKW44_005471, partial [Caligus rogercresseyi]